jgi:hypothetical protein
MKKKLNEDLIRSELQEGSAFFRRPVTTPPDAAAETPAPTPHEAEPALTPLAEPRALADSTSAEDQTSAVSVRPYGSPYARPSVRTGMRRTIRRHPFEFYQDQLESLKRLSIEEQLAGGTGSMSEMVREAVDRYLQTRAPQAGKEGEAVIPIRPDDRTTERPSD